MDHLQTDIDSLESEKGQLKEKLKSIGKKGTGATTPGTENAPSIMNIGSSATSLTAATPMMDNAVQEKIKALREALQHEAREKNKLLIESLEKKLDSLPKLPNLKSNAQDTRIKELQQKKTELLRVSFPI